MIVPGGSVAGAFLSASSTTDQQGSNTSSADGDFRPASDPASNGMSTMSCCCYSLAVALCSNLPASPASSHSRSSILVRGC